MFNKPASTSHFLIKLKYVLMEFNPPGKTTKDKFLIKNNIQKLLLNINNLFYTH